jgi:hypothetical protein
MLCGSLHLRQPDLITNAEVINWSVIIAIHRGVFCSDYDFSTGSRPFGFLNLVSELLARRLQVRVLLGEPILRSHSLK